MHMCRVDARGSATLARVDERDSRTAWSDMRRMLLPPSLLACVLSLAVMVGAEGYFRFSPEHEQCVVLVDGMLSETNVMSFNEAIGGLQRVHVYINGSDTAASWSPQQVNARPYNLTYRPPLNATNIASVFSLTTEGGVKLVSDIDMEGPVLRSLLNRSTCYCDVDLPLPKWVCPLRLNITVTSTLAEQHANYSILVLLSEVDEFPPVLSPSNSTQFTVSEGIPVNTVLVSFDSQQPAIDHSGNVNVTDEDFFSRNSFSFLQSSSTLFLFDSTRGILRTRSNLSTLQPEYPVTCQHDVCFMVLQFHVGEVTQTPFTANISLRPTPHYIGLTPNTGSVEVSEALTVGAVLVSFSPYSVQGLIDVAVNSSHDQLKLSFTDPAIVASGYFLLSDTTKTLSLQRTLDLDVPFPPFLAACSAPPCVAMIGVQVGVFGGGVSAEFGLSLSVTSLNEFGPTFSSAPYSATVPEHAPLGSKVLEVECEDADRFEEVVVSIVSWTPNTEPLPFTLNGSTLLVTGRVGYEEVAIYWVNLSCSDGERENVTEVEVDVRNINDHPPIFDLLLYKFSVPSTAVHTFPLVLGTVHASDVEGDTVTYSLLDNVLIFSVSPAGGQVATLGEVTQTYNLTVVGVDSGTPPLTGSATIQILTAVVPASSSTTPSPPHHTSSPLHHAESDTGASVILIGTSLGLGSVMVVIAVIISVIVPVCVVKRARQHDEVTLDNDVETLLPELEDIAESSPSSSSTSSQEPAERPHDFGELEHVVLDVSVRGRRSLSEELEKQHKEVKIDTDLGTSLLSQEHIPGICLQPTSNPSHPSSSSHPSSPSHPPPVPAERPHNWDLTRTGNSDGPPGEEMELQTHSSAGGAETDLGGSEQQWAESDLGSGMQQGAESDLGDGMQQGAESDLGGGVQQGAGLFDSSPSARIEQGRMRGHKPRVIPDSKKTVV